MGLPMLRGLYAAATALDVARQNQEVTAANLANASLPGSRQQGVRFETFDLALNRADPPLGEILGTRLAGSYHDFRPGATQPTGNPTDLALGEPDTFFVTNGPNGPLYSRNGSFRLTSTGQIVSQGGYPLVGDGGPIAVPVGTANINVASDGSVTADGNPVGQIRLVRFGDNRRLQAVGPSQFSAPEDQPPIEVAGRVLQGYREGSNVNPAEAMVSLVIGSRYYDAAQRVLRTIAESVQQNTRPQS
jgi:flagellar basal-body rod protein FlgF